MIKLRNERSLAGCGGVASGLLVAACEPRFFAGCGGVASGMLAAACEPHRGPRTLVAKTSIHKCTMCTINEVAGNLQGDKC